MKLSAKKLTLTIGTTMLLALANSQAYASPRLCGYIAVDNPSKLGILAEFSDNDSLYHQKCDQALDQAWNKIQSNAQLKAQNWRKIYRNKCWDVGKQGFINPGDDADLLCNNMDSDNGYKITKMGGSTAAFAKQAGSNPGGVGGVANDIDNGVNQGPKAIKNLF